MQMEKHKIGQIYSLDDHNWQYSTELVIEMNNNFKFVIINNTYFYLQNALFFFLF